MTNTTTQHIRALLVDDGREFAMIRKTDLAALMQVADTDPHQGRYLDPIGAHRARAREDALTIEVMRKGSTRMLEDAFKHGFERRQYMANNKALLARSAALEDWAEGLRIDRDHIYETLVKRIDREAILEARLLRVARFKRKYPSIGALMDMTP